MSFIRCNSNSADFFQTSLSSPILLCQCAVLGLGSCLGSAACLSFAVGQGDVPRCWSRSCEAASNAARASWRLHWSLARGEGSFAWFDNDVTLAVTPDQLGRYSCWVLWRWPWGNYSLRMYPYETRTVDWNRCMSVITISTCSCHLARCRFQPRLPLFTLLALRWAHSQHVWPILMICKDQLSPSTLPAPLLWWPCTKQWKMQRLDALTSRSLAEWTCLAKTCSSFTTSGALQCWALLGNAIPFRQRLMVMCAQKVECSSCWHEKIWSCHPMGAFWGLQWLRTQGNVLFYTFSCAWDGNLATMFKKNFKDQIEWNLSDPNAWILIFWGLGSIHGTFKPGTPAALAPGGSLCLRWIQQPRSVLFVSPARMQVSKAQSWQRWSCMALEHLWATLWKYRRLQGQVEILAFHILALRFILVYTHTYTQFVEIPTFLCNDLWAGMQACGTSISKNEQESEMRFDFF